MAPTTTYTTPASPSSGSPLQSPPRWPLGVFFGVLLLIGLVVGLISFQVSLKTVFWVTLAAAVVIGIFTLAARSSTPVATSSVSHGVSKTPKSFSFFSLGCGTLCFAIAAGILIPAGVAFYNWKTAPPPPPVVWGEKMELRKILTTPDSFDLWVGDFRIQNHEEGTPRGDYSIRVNFQGINHWVDIPADRDIQFPSGIRIGETKVVSADKKNPHV